MISWIQLTLQRHFRVFFAILLVFIIVSFVIYFAPGVGFDGSGMPKPVNRPFYGVNLGSQEDQERLFGDASLSVFLQAGYPALNQAQLQDYALQRQAGLHLASQLNLPGPTSEQLGEFIQGLGAFVGEQGGFDAASYAQFRDNIRLNPQISEGDVTRVINDDFRFNQIQELLAGPGYVLPAEVKDQLTRSDSTWTLDVARVDLAGFSPEINPTDANVVRYFEDNIFRYEIPAHVKVRYTTFSNLDYLNQVVVTEAQVRAHYNANPLRFPKPSTNPETTPAIGVETGIDADFAAVRPQVEATLRLERAQRLAASAASDLSLAIFEAGVPPDGVEAFLATRNLTLQDVEPFSADHLPPQFAGSPTLAAEAFKLNADRHFTDALPTSAGSVVLFWQETIPPRAPLLIEVRDQVIADYRASEKRRLSVELGRTVRDALRTRLAAGESFEQAVGAASVAAGVAIEVGTYEPFTRRTPPANVEQAALGSLDSLNEGDVADMVISDDQGLLVYVQTKTPPDLTEANPRYALMRDQVAQFTASQNANDYLGEMVQTELARTAPVLP